MTAMLDVAQPQPRGDLARPPHILFVNDLWGYGTVTMAMAVASELEGRATCLFAGQGPGFELARRAICFDALLATDTMAEPISPELDAALRGSRAVVTVMNGPVARRAVELGVPCLYLDCMLWMWAAPPDVPPSVPYHPESFPGVTARWEQWRDRFPEGEVVGPLVTRPARGRSDAADAVLINFGGLSCALLDRDTLAAYADAMTRCAVMALDGWPGRVVVAAGQHVLGLMDEDALRAIRPGVELVDLGHDAYLAELRRSQLLISSAGMHALYEACALGVPFVGLPAQNLSGSLALEVLERDGVHHALDWRHLYGLTGLDSSDEPDACRRIAECIHRFKGDPDAQETLVGHLSDALQADQLERSRLRQVAFLAAQGEGGAADVASRVLQLMGTRAPVLAT
jgi:hypothetical protein